MRFPLLPLLFLPLFAVAGDPVDAWVDEEYARRSAAALPEDGRSAFELEARVGEGDDFADWTLFGREPTERDRAAIAENLRRLDELEALDGPREESGPWSGEGGVIRDLTADAGWTGWFAWRARESRSVWPLHFEEDETSAFAPDGSVRWVSAPEPWVIHHRPPFVGVWTPSPFYDNPYVLTMVPDGAGGWRHEWVNVWPRAVPTVPAFEPSRTRWGVASDSALGRTAWLDLLRPWGAASWRTAKAEAPDDGGGKRRFFSLSFDSGPGGVDASRTLPIGDFWSGPPATVIRRSGGSTWIGTGIRPPAPPALGGVLLLPAPAGGGAEGAVLLPLLPSAGRPLLAR